MTDGGLRGVVVETDSQSLVNLSNSREHRAEIMPILIEIQELVRRGGVFLSFELIHVRRNANLVPNKRLRRVLCTWLNQIPGFLLSCLQHDCTPD